MGVFDVVVVGGDVAVLGHGVGVAEGALGWAIGEDVAVGGQFIKCCCFIILVEVEVADLIYDNDI
ncbi:MAG: hypothetical protein A2Y07_03360 [Planctomycetes bacterium GWF2_50_10]|nr:MAG: hypothetical protein A2Y07_03360 [Planctomycetes bacterium GWF2_50_10]